MNDIADYGDMELWCLQRARDEPENAWSGKDKPSVGVKLPMLVFAMTSANGRRSNR